MKTTSIDKPMLYVYNVNQDKEQKRFNGRLDFYSILNMKTEWSSGKENEPWRIAVREKLIQDNTFRESYPLT